MAGSSWQKSSAALVARFDATAARFPDVERRKMFGYPALFVGGNLATGLFQDSWMVRLADADLAELLALPGTAPFAPMAGRAMKGYAVLPPDILADDAELESWVRRAIDLGRSLPPKR